MKQKKVKKSIEDEAFERWRSFSRIKAAKTGRSLQVPSQTRDRFLEKYNAKSFSLLPQIPPLATPKSKTDRGRWRAELISLKPSSFHLNLPICSPSDSSQTKRTWNQSARESYSKEKEKEIEKVKEKEKQTEKDNFCLFRLQNTKLDLSPKVSSAVLNSVGTETEEPKTRLERTERVLLSSCRSRMILFPIESCKSSRSIPPPSSPSSSSREHFTDPFSEPDFPEFLTKRTEELNVQVNLTKLFEEQKKENKALRKKHKKRRHKRVSIDERVTF